MRYAQIRSMDIANGPGICTTLYVQGCNRHCKHCFNPETWDYNGGYVWNKNIEDEFIDICNLKYINNVCILGGEPLDQGIDLFNLLSRIKEEVKKPIWLWTGYTWEDIVEDNSTLTQQIFNSDKAIKGNILGLCDVVIDGPFMTDLYISPEQSENDCSLWYKGSSNQRVIDVKKTIEQNKIVLLET